jgi:hypothetical protein
LLISVAGVGYRYGLRGGEEVIATGHLSREQPLEIGDRIEVGGQHTIEPLLGEPELRLVANGSFKDPFPAEQGVLTTQRYATATSNRASKPLVGGSNPPRRISRKFPPVW